VEIRYDAKGRMLFESFEVGDDFRSEKVCTYADGPKTGTCVKSIGPEPQAVETEVTQFDADGRRVEQRFYKGASTATADLAGRVDYQWRSEGCPSVPNWVRYGRGDEAIGRHVVECDGEGRATLRRWYGWMYGGKQLSRALAERLSMEHESEHDVDRGVRRVTKRSRELRDDGLSEAWAPVQLSVDTLDVQGQIIERRTQTVEAVGDTGRSSGDEIEIYDYSCWGGTSDSSSKGQSAIEQAKAMKAKAAPLIKILTGRWNFVADDGDKMVFLLQQGKLGIVEKGEYSEVAATVVGVGQKHLTLRIKPPAGSDEAPLRFDVRLIDEKSIIVSMPGKPSQKGRMYVR